MRVVEEGQGIQIACLEEIAYNMGYIDDKQMQSLIDELKKGNYKDYLIKVLEEKHELY